MISYNKFKLNTEKGNISNYIYNWSFGKDKILNVVTIPYNGCDVFIKTVIESINNKKTVLYITDEDEMNIKIIERLKRITDFKDYTYVRNNFIKNDKRLVISNHSNINKLRFKYDLVIYDDINSYPKYSNNEIKEALLSKCNDNGKIIAYSLEKVFEASREILLPVDDCKLPMVEPRVITTKVDVNKDIPYVIYEYLRWSISINRRVAIYVPDYDKAKNVFYYLNKNYSKIIKNLVCYTNEENNVKDAVKNLRVEKGILVTNECEGGILSYKNTNIIVLFADDVKFDYKKLVNICGKVEKGEKEGRGEVIFLVSEETNDIEKAKDITRNFNKEAWELGLINI